MRTHNSNGTARSPQALHASIMDRVRPLHSLACYITNGSGDGEAGFSLACGVLALMDDLREVETALGDIPDGEEV